MRLLVSIAAVITASVTVCAQTTDPSSVPRFEAYPAKLEQLRKPAPTRLSNPQTRHYATELREASHHPPNFAGHYILATWGCGASCLMAAAIDAKTGSVTLLPFTVSNWPLNVTEPLAYKPNSRLLLVQGNHNEWPSTTSAYEFTGHTFRPLPPDHPLR